VKIPENIHTGKETLEYEVPWLVPEAIFLLDKLLTKDMRVLEFGSGGSTLFFSKRTRSVTSFEDDLKWYTKVLGILNKKKITNVGLVFYTKKWLEDNFPTDGFNCVLIDNKISRNGVRRKWLLEKSVPLLTEPKIFILDNYGTFSSDKLTDEAFIEKYSLEGCREETYNHPKWKGCGTRVFYNAS